MKETLESLIKEIENVALDVVMLDSEDIPGLGKALQSL